MSEVKAVKLLKNVNEIKKNILYLSAYGYESNFYYRVKECPFSNIIATTHLNNISLEPYDGFIIHFSVFNVNDNVVDLVDEIISLGKPVIIIYNSKFTIPYCGFEYLSKKFDIKFEERECSIIEDKYDDYSIGNVSTKGYAVSMFSNKGYGKAFIKNTEKCYILRFNNVSIVHDVEASYIGLKNEHMHQIQTTYLNLLSTINQTIKPEWISKIKIINDESVETEIKELDKQINILKKQKLQKEIILTENEEYKKVLYTSGDELVKIVEKMLSEMLNVSVTDIDVKKEDLSLTIGNKKVLIEVKGVNTPIKREYVSQLRRHIEDDANLNGVDDDEISKRYKGVLIINPYIKLPVQERISKDFYSKTVESDIKHDDIFAIDTITFLNIYNRFRCGERIDMSKYILNNNYIKPDFSIIK